MSTKNWIPVNRVEGEASRQAHADLPEGTYEREISKDGFFGPAAFLYHRRPPTGWTGFEGPLRPRAFNLAALNEADPSPWAAPAANSKTGRAVRNRTRATSFIVNSSTCRSVAFRTRGGRSA